MSMRVNVANYHRHAAPAASRAAAPGVQATKAPLALPGVAEVPPQVPGLKLPGEPLTPIARQPIGTSTPKSAPGSPGALISLEA